MIVDVYKIFTENSFGQVFSYNLCVENNLCQSRVTALALSWLSSKGQLASIDKPNFRYQYSELASDEIRNVVMTHGYAIFTADEAQPQLEVPCLEMDGVGSFS